MAKESAIARNNKRIAMVLEYSEKRKELTDLAKDSKRSLAERRASRQLLSQFPLNSHPNRIRNRDFVNGRPRAYIRYFGLSRITFREMALKGLLPGIRKASL